MTFKVPLWIGLVIACAVSINAYGDSCTNGNTYCKSLGEFQQAEGCSSPSSDESTNVMCSWASDTFCSLNKTTDGCQSFGPNGLAFNRQLMTQPSTNKWGTSDDSVKAQGQLAEDVVSRLQQKAQGCCGSADNCPEGKQSDAAAALASADSDDASKDKSVTGAAGAIADANTNAGTVSAQTSGVCKARKEVCRYEALKYVDDLQAHKPSPCPSCDGVISSLQNTASACAGLDDHTTKQQADRNFDDASKANQDKAAASAQPSGTTPSSTTHSGVGGGSNPMSSLAAIAPLMQAMMNQARPPTADNSQTASQPDCSNTAIVAPFGVCPPQAAAQQTAWAPASAQGGFQSGTQPGSNYNTGTLADNMVGQTQALPMGYNGNPQGLKTDPVNGNSGGFGGGIGSASGGAQLGSAARPAGQPRVDTNIMAANAVGASQFSQNYGGDASPVTGGGGYTNPIREANVDPAVFLPKLNSKFLRGLAGGNAQLVQIQSKEVNIWNRISEHIKARCSQGLLRDCVP